MTLKEQIIEYRNSHIDSRLILGTVLGEFDRISKNPTDLQCQSIIRKMIESNIITGQLDENIILNRFIPQQLDENTIKGLIEETGFSNIGECMKFFKENYSGLYDGKLVNNVFNVFKYK